MLLSYMELPLTSVQKLTLAQNQSTLHLPFDLCFFLVCFWVRFETVAITFNNSHGLGPGYHILLFMLQ